MRKILTCARARGEIIEAEYYEFMSRQCGRKLRVFLVLRVRLFCGGRVAGVDNYEICTSIARRAHDKRSLRM